MVCSFTQRCDGGTHSSSPSRRTRCHQEVRVELALRYFCVGGTFRRAIEKLYCCWCCCCWLLLLVVVIIVVDVVVVVVVVAFSWRIPACRPTLGWGLMLVALPEDGPGTPPAKPSGQHRPRLDLCRGGSFASFKLCILLLA